MCLCACLFICALWSPAGKGLTSWLSFVVSNCDFVTFPISILGQVWYLIVSIPDLCTLTNLNFTVLRRKRDLLFALALSQLFPLLIIKILAILCEFPFSRYIS